MEDGYTVEKHKSVSNPCIIYAFYYADKFLAETMREAYLNLKNLSINIEGPWQYLFIDTKSVGYDE